MVHQENSANATRNSPLRGLGKPIIEGGVDLMRKYTPGLTPDHINHAMLVGTAIGAGLAYRAETSPNKRIRNKVVAGTVLVGSALMDGFDGALARRLAAEGHKVDFNEGAIKDTNGDRWRNAIVGFVNEHLAHRRGSSGGVYWERLRQFTNPMSSLLRAANEARGVVVKEGGVDKISFFGTEVGRTILGIAEATAPVVRGVDLQKHLARFGTFANLWSAARRVHEGLTTAPTLDLNSRKEAADRKRALSSTTIAVISIPLIVEFIRRQKDRKPVQSDAQLNEHYKKIIGNMEFAGQEFLEGKHRFVGSIFPDLIKSHIQDGKVVIDSELEYDFEKREIRIRNHKPLQLRREDDTMRDTDAIILETSETRKNHFEGFRRGVLADARAQGMPYAHIGAESAFNPDGKRKRNGKRQLVSAFEIDKAGQTHLVFDDIDFPLSDESLEAWKLITEDDVSFTMLNPLGHWLCYYIRSPIAGPKIKDVESGKLDMLEEVARGFFRAGMKEGINYADVHENWFQYIDRVLEDQRPSFRARSAIVKLWWATVGTAVSHGRWPFEPIVNRSGGFEG